MRGIVGLHLRTPELYPRLGELLTGMLCEMSNRGSDSAGVAVYGDRYGPRPAGLRVLLDVGTDAEAIGVAVGSALGGDVTQRWSATPAY
jgi:amidophosphoribosyltransferase